MHRTADWRLLVISIERVETREPVEVTETVEWARLGSRTLVWDGNLRIAGRPIPLRTVMRRWS